MNPTKSYKKVAKVAQIFSCELCNYTTSKKYNYEKHLSTLKHKKQQNPTKSYKKVAKVAKIFCCECGKHYAHRTTLYNHKKTCESVTNNDMQIIVKKLKELKEENKELKEAIDDIKPNIENTIINKNKFNINLFLKDTCRDAINMSDFVNSLQIQLDDLNYTKTNGLIEGISFVLLNRLKELDTNHRPIHCTDIKRETLYIKDNDEWEKEEEGRNKLRQVINDVANKHRIAIMELDKVNPKNIETEKDKDEYVQMVKNVMTEISDEKKIIKRVAKETIIEKE